MTRLFETFVRKSIIQPRALLLVDGFGAILSAVLLGIVLVEFGAIFGMPANVLYILALLPCVFAIFDFLSAAKKRSNYGSLLKIIAVANFAYCLLSIGAIILHFQVLTIWGIGYFISELIIVSALVIIEWKTAGKLVAIKRS